MAYFMRARKVDLAKLENAAQENLEVVHAILVAAIKEIKDKVRALERKFYGPGGTALTELRRWSPHLRNVMMMSGLSHLGSLNLVNEIIRQSSMPERKFSVDTADVAKLKDCLRKCMDATPHKFANILEDLRRVANYCEKYCQSFCDPDRDPFLETAHTYEKQRQIYAKNILDGLDNIPKMAAKFKIKELHVSDLSPYSVELARKGECQPIGFLLMFPEACENIKTVCASILNWIDFDGNYAQFISNDVKDLEIKKEDTLKSVREIQQKYHQLSFRHKTIEVDCDKLEYELKKLQDKEEELIIEEEFVTSETNDMQLEIEIKEYRRDELIKNAAVMHPEVLYEKYSELSEDLRDLKSRLPFVKRQMLNARSKLEWINIKKEEHRIEKKKLVAAEKEMDEADQNKVVQEVELENAARALVLARQIHLYKTSPDAVEKIFLERPVEVNSARLPGKAQKDDLFEKICELVISMIETDWPKLYRALPFYPSRGLTTIDEDVKEFSGLESRCGLEHIARRCIYRWRRFHTRSKLDDVKDALTQIRRHDILEEVDLVINPPKDEEEVEEIPTYVEEYLIPFIREVEKFDRLRAANKI